MDIWVVINVAFLFLGAYLGTCSISSKYFSSTSLLLTCRIGILVGATLILMGLGLPYVTLMLYTGGLLFTSSVVTIIKSVKETNERQ